ncbi:MAG: hypothetical protein KDE19_10970 [Caldilineaceae bacterium]|nr:hypothetical protein [Caldilineaceae bacterium]
MTMRTTDTTTTPTRTTTSSPWGGAAMAGVVSLIVNVIVAWIIWLIIPPAEASDLGYLLTMVGITSFFAGLFAYYGAFQQSNRV